MLLRKGRVNCESSSNRGKKIIISTIQKFPFILDEIGNEQRGHRFAIIIDDSFRVHDDDHAGSVPAERIDDVAAAITSTLTRKTAVKRLFQRYLRFDETRDAEPVSDLSSRVVIDNNSSDYATIIDVFAHDRPGLLYTISRAIFKLGLSVSLARIATHLDQVVDVFYVTDTDGGKIADEERINFVRGQLEATIGDFEREGHRLFAP